MTEKEIQVKANEKMDKLQWTYWYPKHTWGERDIFGVFDFVAITPAGRLHLVQLTTKNHVSHRRHKILNWCAANNVPPTGEIWAWDPKVALFFLVKL